VAGVPVPTARGGAALVAAVCVAAGTAIVVTVVLVPVTVRVTAGAVAVFVRVSEIERVVLVDVAGAADCDAALGDSVSTTDAGSDARPIGWLKTRLAAHVTPAVSPIPSSAASGDRSAPRLTRAG
jgi:hypothetical protein